MKSRVLLSAIALAGLSLLSHSSFAEGVYVLGAVGSSMATSSSKTDNDNILIAAGFTNLNTSMSNGTALKALVGYEFNPNIAIEGGYIDSGTMTYSGTATGVAFTADVKATGMQFAILGIAPINDKFSLFAKAAYSAVSVKTTGRVNTTLISSSTDKNNGGYGFGASYKFTDKLAIRGEWESVASDVNAATIGLQMKF